jgi:predicted MFS family arabinose efflux permease
MALLVDDDTAPAGSPHAGQPPFALKRRAACWVSAGVVAHTLWTSAAPAMVYPLYAEQWHLTHATITAIFAIYPVVVVAVLVGFGDISDYLGRRAAMLLGLAASLTGVLLFALAPSVIWLFAGRALMGIGVGLTAGPSTAAVIEFSGAGQSRIANSVTTAAQAAGFAAALLIGGALVQYAPLPTRLSFWVLFGVIAILLAGTWFLPRHTVIEARGPWRPKVPFIPLTMRASFTLAALAITTAYTHGVLILSLGAQVARDLVGSSNALTNGAALALFAVVSGLIGLVARSVTYRPAMLLGAAASALSMALFAVAVSQHQLAVFLAATATAGGGYSLLFLGGLNLINASAPAQHRGGVLSALYLFAYLSLGVAALVLGEVATLWGLALAVDLGAAAISLLSAATVVVLLRYRPDGRPPAR